MGRLEPASQPDLHMEPLFDDRHVVLASAKSKWARRHNLTLAELAGEPWVLPPPDSLMGGYLTAAFRAAGLEPPGARVVTFSIPLHQTLLATGRFLTALPASMLHHHARVPFKVLPIKFPASLRTTGIVTLKNRTLSTLAVRFIESAREVAKSLPNYQDDSDRLGMKWLGEIGIVGVAAAIANAVYHATGKRVRDLPITLDKLQR